jgi:hypothetical protein
MLLYILFLKDIFKWRQKFHFVFYFLLMPFSFKLPFKKQECFSSLNDYWISGVIYFEVHMYISGGSMTSQDNEFDDF